LKDTLTEKQKIHLNKHLENAIKNNDIIGRYFVKIGGQIDTANLSLQDPVFFDPVFFNRKNTVEILIDLGVKVNINDLCIAAYMGRTEIASLLLEAVRKDGCDVVAFINSRGILFPESESSSFHSTPELPLSEAASNGKDSVVKLLLDNDADSNLSSYDNYGSASLSSAIRRMKYTINEIEDTKNERPSSLRLWCDNDARNRYNEKCADMKKNMKKMKGYNETVKLLLEASNDKIRTKHGKEAIELLAGYQRDKSKYDQRTTCSKLKQLLT
jgi:ankyrin repeat protein